MKKKLELTPLDYGIMLGVLLSMLTCLVYIINIGLLADVTISIIITLLTLFLVILLGILSAKSKRNLDGSLSFKTSFLAFFCSVTFGLLLSALFSYVLFNIVDTEAEPAFKKILMNDISKRLTAAGAPKSIIFAELNALKNKNIFGLYEIIKSNVIYMFLTAFLGLIVSLFLKKLPSNSNYMNRM